MTSDANDVATRDFFKKNNFFGYSPNDVFFFQQGMMPALSDFTGKLLRWARRIFARPFPRMAMVEISPRSTK